MTKNTASGSFRSYETLRTLSVNQFTDPTKSPLYTVTFPLYTVTFPFTLHCHGVTFPFTIHCALSFPLTGTATFPFTVHCHFCLCSTLPVTFPFRVHCHLFFQSTLSPFLQSTLSPFLLQYTPSPFLLQNTVTFPCAIHYCITFPFIVRNHISFYSTLSPFLLQYTVTYLFTFCFVCIENVPGLTPLTPSLVMTRIVSHSRGPISAPQSENFVSATQYPPCYPPWIMAVRVIQN